MTLLSVSHRDFSGDFIISILETILRNHFLLFLVGGGSAGSTVAGRLAENGFNILLLEAGGPPPWWATLGAIDIPIFGPLWQNTDLDWAYTTEPQTHSCGALKGRVSSGQSSCVLGYHPSSWFFGVYMPFFYPIEKSVAKRKSTGWIWSLE